MSSSADLAMPVEDDLPPRQETFLARYPRKLKLAATGLFVFLLVLPWLIRFAFEDSPTFEQPPETVTAQAPQKEEGATNIEAAPAGPVIHDIKIAEPIDEATDPGIAQENDTDDHNARLAKAPDPDLTEDTAEGGLPKIGANGREVWQVYARPFNAADKRPRIALVMVDMGLSNFATDSALQRLPANVTMAFDVQSPVVAAWLSRARQDGHETLLTIPMEPLDYPRSDPGPQTLLTSIPKSDNIKRLNWSLRQGTGYVGLTTLTGSRLTTDIEKLTPILDSAHRRGLLVFDAHVAQHSIVKEASKRLKIPFAESSRQIDLVPTPDAIDATLYQLEQSARLSGKAVAIATPLPVTLDRLELWIKQLPKRGIALAPLSSIVQ